ncbi:MAG: hypothetical protein ACLPND_14830 [Candidatus Korobacteraceae bacterium]
MDCSHPDCLRTIPPPPFSERDITGKVRLIGDNLRATDDFAKKAATVAQETLSSASPFSDSTKSGYKNVI